jgi:NAD(P)-dependent dehydrogenase (short-subunit alcohol dehydrogenase family)
MARYRGIVVSGRSAEDTFDYMAEFSNGAEWDPGVAGAERLDEGPVGLGSRFRLDVRVGGRSTPFDYAIESYERPHRVVLVAENAFVRSEDTITVVPRPSGGSVLTYDAQLSLRGALSPFSGALALPFRRIGDRGLGGLRRVLGVEPSVASTPASSSRAAELAADAVDELLEATVVGSFSSVGPAVRSRLAGWRPPPSLDGRVVLITGATSGLGLATAIGVARLGATVRFVARSRERAQQAVATIGAAAPGADVAFQIADLGELDQVREVAADFTAVHDRLDVLVHNAGALSKEYTVTGAGTELTVASQLVAPFLLSGLLLPELGAAVPSRVIQVSSGGMYTQRFDLDRLEMGPTDYDGTVAYARVKRAQLVLMHEWVRRFGGSGIVFHAMHPGWADTPGIRSGLPGFARVMGPLLRSADEGADTAVWLASAPEAVATTGGFWLDRRLRWENKVPWTRLDEAQFVKAGSDLWAWCAERSGWDGVPPGH